MKILVYEDNDEDLERLLECLNNFFENKKMKYNVKICTESKQLYDYALDHDLVFLDIETNDESGIEIGINIRKNNPDIKIIFVTKFSKYLIDGYKASANRYFLKPLNQELFNFELEDVMNDYLLNNVSFFDYKIQSNKIYLKNIIYIEFKNRKTYLHFSSGKIVKAPYPLKYWKEKLAPYFFVQSHKAFLVNLRQINNYTNIDVILSNGENIPLSRMYKKEFEKHYLESLKRSV